MSYKIKHADEYKDPFLCYCTIRHFEKTVEEEFLDYGESIVDAHKFAKWLYENNQITEDVFNILEYDDELELIAFGELDVLFELVEYSFGIGDLKLTSLLAEYISTDSKTRQSLFDEMLNYMDEIILDIEEARLNEPVHRYSREELINLVDDIYELDYHESWNILQCLTLNEALELSA